MAKNTQNVMVTGHQGYIGPVLIRQLRARGHTVVGFDTGYFRDCHESAAEICAPEQEITADIRDISKEHLSGVDSVIHLAGLSNDPLGEVAERMTEKINTVGTARIGALAREAGVTRFAFASSCSIYGAASDQQDLLDESAEFAPVSAYAHSKVDGERSLLDLKNESFRPIMLRNATAYGVSPRTRLDLVVGNLMAHAVSTGIVRVLSDGTPWRPMVHIEDISNAAIAAIEADDHELAFDSYNIGRTDANYTVADIAQMVADSLPGTSIEITGETGGDPRSYRVDFSRAEDGLPGFDPAWRLEDGIAQIRDWLLDLGTDDETYLFSSRFIRLKQLRELLDGGEIDPDFYWSEQDT